MATKFLEFPSPETIVCEEDEMVAAKSTPDWKGWLTLVLAVLVAVGGATWALWREFSELDKHIARVETAVRIIGAKQGGDTQTLVDESLKIALNDSKAGQPDKAKAVLAITNRLVSDQIAAHAPITQASIQTTFLQYQALKQMPLLADQAHEGMIKLAEYHSVALPEAPVPKSAYVGESDHIGRFWHFKNSIFIGNHALGNGPESSEGTVLDGLFLQNVTFEGSVIIYHSGPVILQNVKFVNCKFRIDNSRQGDQLLQTTIEPEATVRMSHP
jgi:hypothetical protein